MNYKTFDTPASEVLRLNFRSRRVLADGQELPQRADLGGAGWTFDAQRAVLRVQHENSRLVRVLGR